MKPRLAEVLKDVVKHTNDTDRIEAVKITNNKKETTIDAMDEMRTMVLKGKLKKPLKELPQGDIGLGRLKVLKGYLNTDVEKIEHGTVKSTGMSTNGELVSSINFTTTDGMKASYIPMTPAMIDDQLKQIKFKGVAWDVVVAPFDSAIKQLTDIDNLLGKTEPCFQPYVKDKNLYLKIGEGANDKAEILFDTGVAGKLDAKWGWPTKELLKILNLAERNEDGQLQAVMKFSSLGAMQIDISTDHADYSYIMPARSF
tara:strand:- start:923 stop:1690 length:768 start_codon:yes stop_codon:yes gene_type:complete